MGESRGRNSVKKEKIVLKQDFVGERGSECHLLCLGDKDDMVLEECVSKYGSDIWKCVF